MRRDRRPYARECRAVTIWMDTALRALVGRAADHNRRSVSAEVCAILDEWSLRTDFRAPARPKAQT
jgi:hypothetical protein